MTHIHDQKRFNDRPDYTLTTIGDENTIRGYEYLRYYINIRFTVFLHDIFLYNFYADSYA